MAIRSVYDLVANGIISRPALREALSSKGVSARDVLDAIVTRHESPKKRRRLDKPSVLEAAQSGIDSRITRAVLSGWQGDWSDIERTVDLTPLESVTSWSGNVMLAARLRVLNTLKWAQDARLMEFDAGLLADDAVLLETRLELVSDDWIALTLGFVHDRVRNQLRLAGADSGGARPDSRLDVAHDNRFAVVRRAEVSLRTCELIQAFGCRLNIISLCCEEIRT